MSLLNNLIKLLYGVGLISFSINKTVYAIFNKLHALNVAIGRTFNMSFALLVCINLVFVITKLQFPVGAY
ncbi:MAG: hypothetical protein COA59_01440 [Colwellia sp.]|jgi:hypothetical protein|nr:MAG: hypothetical protein COA59_01440 [Colwellia sp.]